MLGKLLKHDFRSSGKVLFPLNLLLVIVTVIGSVLLGTKLLQRTEMVPLAITLLITYILMLVAISVITSIFLIVSYYRNMFSSQGYLTFTLPASPWMIYNSKMIVGFFWVGINSILTLVSAIILIVAACGFKNMFSLLSDVFVSDLVIGSGTGAVSYPTSLLTMIGYTPVQFILLMLAMFLVSCFYSMAMGYGSVTIGQLYAKHKVLGAVLAYVVIYYFSQIIMNASMLFISFRSMFGIIAVSEETLESSQGVMNMMQSIYKPMFPTIILIQLVIGVACYVASVIILKKKVNLD